MRECKRIRFWEALTAAETSVSALIKYDGGVHIVQYGMRKSSFPVVVNVLSAASAFRTLLVFDSESNDGEDSEV